MKEILTSKHSLAIALCFVGLTLTLNSCEKIVSIDLNKANPHVVIEGIVTDQPSPDSVVLSRSGDYFEASLTFPPVPNAAVTIADNAGTVDTLKEDGP